MAPAQQAASSSEPHILDNPPFSSLTLKPDLLRNLATLNYLQMTPIQAESLPHILHGGDVIGQAKTGSGKTAAFGLGLLQRLEVQRFRVQCLVLCPTRELADQVANEVRRLARGIHNVKVLTLCGGVAFGPQKGSLAHGAHVVVGTPGRIEEHLRKGNLSLEHLNTFILDEADRMLDMGFLDVINLVLKHVPLVRQTMLFSATFPNDIRQLSERVTHNAVHVKVDTDHSDISIRQLLYQIPERGARIGGLISILHHHKPTSALVFCNTRQLTTDVAFELNAKGFSAQPLHGDLEQKDRDDRLIRFSNQSLSVLVATDVAARGLDIDSLDLVVNDHLSKDPEVHTHRIGRTGRAGTNGIACSLYLAGEENRIELLEGMTGARFERPLLPEINPGSQPQSPPMVSLLLDGGKKQKVRPGDILGALTGDGIEDQSIGKITIRESAAIVAVERAVAKRALTILQQGKVKGRSFRARRLSDLN